MGQSTSRRRLLALAVFALLCFAPVAAAHPLRYLGPHPIAAQLGGGFCYIDGAHFHSYVPDQRALYTHVDGGLYFTADPTPFGYDGPRHVYYGQHPIPGQVIPGAPLMMAGGAPPEVYCFLRGPHSHAWQVPEGPAWREQGGVTYYVGSFGDGYERERRQRERGFEVAYRPFDAQRPVVVAPPPPEWSGVPWVPGPPSVALSVTAPALPSVQVYVPPPPSIYAPPPPRFAVHDVRLIAPPPPLVGIYAPSAHVEYPAPRIVSSPFPSPFPSPTPSVARYEQPHDRGRHEGWYERGEHEDRGRHNGWYERGHGNGKHGRERDED